MHVIKNNWCTYLFLILLLGCYPSPQITTVKILAPDIFRLKMREFMYFVEGQSKIRLQLFFYRPSKWDWDQIEETMEISTKKNQNYFDIMIGPTNWTNQLQKLEYLQPIRPYQLPFYPNLKPRLRSTIFDPSGIYSLPFAIRQFGMWINSDFIREKTNGIKYRSLALFFEKNKHRKGGRGIKYGRSYESLSVLKIFSQIYQNRALCAHDYRTRRYVRRQVANSKQISRANTLLAADIGVHLGEKTKISHELLMLEDESIAQNWKFVFPNEGAVYQMYSFFLLKSTNFPATSKRILNYYLHPQLAQLRMENHLTNDRSAIYDGHLFSDLLPQILIPACYQLYD